MGSVLVHYYFSQVMGILDEGGGPPYSLYLHEIDIVAMRFKFDRKYWPDPENTPWQITPIWIEEFPEEYRMWGTIFVVKLKPEAVPNVVKELEGLSSRVLLFTRKLKQVELRWNGNRRVFSKSEEILKREGDYYVMKEVRIEEDNDGREGSPR